MGERAGLPSPSRSSTCSKGYPRGARAARRPHPTPHQHHHHHHHHHPGGRGELGGRDAPSHAPLAQGQRDRAELQKPRAVRGTRASPHPTPDPDLYAARASSSRRGAHRRFGGAHRHPTPTPYPAPHSHPHPNPGTRVSTAMPTARRPTAPTVATPRPRTCWTRRLTRRRQRRSRMHPPRTGGARRAGRGLPSGGGGPRRLRGTAERPRPTHRVTLRVRSQWLCACAVMAERLNHGHGRRNPASRFSPRHWPMPGTWMCATEPCVSDPPSMTDGLSILKNSRNATPKTVTIRVRLFLLLQQHRVRRARPLAMQPAATERDTCHRGYRLCSEVQLSI